MSGERPYETHTGWVYFQRITSREANRRVRARFQELVLRIAPPGGALFDFGAGPGIDAKFFAERGFTVDAYDIDPKMCETFAVHCREFLDSGRVTLDCTGYREFLARKAPTAGRFADLVISNFAPLNQIEVLPELFGRFHALTAPTGKLLLSVLTPFYLGDMTSRWWWHHALRLWGTGHVRVATGGAPPHTRRRLADFCAAALPYFRLTRVFPGLAADPKQRPQGIDMTQWSPGAWLRLLRSQFTILLFEKSIHDA